MWVCVCCLDPAAPRHSREEDGEGETDGAAQGNQEGKIDKWLIAFTLVVETDTERDRDEYGDRPGEKQTRLRHNRGEKERNGKNHLFRLPLDRDREETRYIN